MMDTRTRDAALRLASRIYNLGELEADAKLVAAAYLARTRGMVEVCSNHQSSQCEMRRSDFIKLPTTCVQTCSVHSCPIRTAAKGET